MPRPLRVLPPALALVLASYAVPLTAAPAATAAEGGASGWTKGRSGTLHEGCHGYTYRYGVDVATESWSLEVTVVDPAGEAVASDLLHAETEPAVGKRRYLLCRASTRPGRFTIRARLVAIDGWGRDAVQLDRSRFRLRAR